MKATGNRIWGPGDGYYILSFSPTSTLVVPTCNMALDKNGHRYWLKVQLYANRR